MKLSLGTIVADVVNTHVLSFFLFSLILVNQQSISGTLDAKQEYTVDGTLIYCRTPCTH